MEQQGNVCGAIVTVDARRDWDCGGRDGGGVEVSVSEFNYSTERFFEVSDAVSALCGDAADEPRAVDEEEVRRFTSMVTFLTEWKYFNYEPKSVTFAYDGGFVDVSAAAISGIHLPQSLLPVFQRYDVERVKEDPCGKSEGLNWFAPSACPVYIVMHFGVRTLLENTKDFVLHAGGSVWALDWCPRRQRKAGGYFKCELRTFLDVYLRLFFPRYPLIRTASARYQYLAVAAHPPGSSYHKIGIPLTGRGLVQIWCVLNVNKEGDSSTVCKVRKNLRGRPRKCPVDVDGKGESLSNDKLKTRGRPRKYPPEFDGDSVPPQKRARIATRIKHSGQSASVNQAEPISLIDSSPGNLPFRDTPTLALTNEESDLRHEIDELSKVEMLSELDAKKAPDFPKKGRGRPRKNPVAIDPRLSDLNAMTTLNFTKKGRMQPRKNPVAIEPTSSSNCAAVNLGKEVLVSRFTSSHEPTSDSNAYTSTLSSISSLNLGRDFVFRRCESDVHSKNSSLADANVEKLPSFLKHGRGSLIKNPLVMTPLTSTSSSAAVVSRRMGEGTLALPAMSGQKWAEGSSGNLTISSNLSESDGITDGGSCARKFEGDDLLPIEGLIETCTEMSPLQQKGKGGFRKDHSIAELISSSSAMAAISCSTSLNSLGEDLYLSPNADAPDKKTHKNVAFGPQGDEVLGKFSGYLNVETIMPQQCKGRKRKQSSEAKSRNAPHVAEDSSAPSSLSASNSQFTSNFISPSKNLPNGNVYNDTDPGCEAEDGISPHTSETSSIQTQCKNKPRKVPPEAISSKGTCETNVMNFEQLIPVCVELSDMPLRQNANRETGIINEEVMLGAMQPDGVLQEQECLDMGVVGSAVKFVLSNSASKRRIRRAKVVVKSNTFPPTLPDVCKTMAPNLEWTCQDLHIHEALDGHEVPLKIDKTDSVLPKDIALPRVVLCLAHMGKVAWDIKWRPFQDTSIECGHRMGYLAVLLGNGSLEVWEVPIPSLVKTLYTSSESTDPRFLRLKPVFRCSKLNQGDKQSIPLVIEWSPSSRDLLLAGCHDGTVALWKFSETSSSIDSKPLLCFNADSMPIRSISWAPDEGDMESSNLIVTAGGERLRFWDLRDPYRPVWDYCPVQRHILAIDWLSDPKWIVLSYDDGFIRVLNLCKAASDIPLTGKPSGPSKTGTHSIACSAFAIWGIHVSPVTGHIAYCGVDGHTNHFQLTNVKIDRSSKNRVPQFSCGSLREKDHYHIITIPVPNRPLVRSSGSLCASANPNQSGSDVEVTDSTKAFPKTKFSTKKGDGPKVTNALTCFIEEKACPSGAYTGTDGPRESFPAKSIAMHKVRWNINRGSEKWLCYGGAAGIVRCYEIS